MNARGFFKKIVAVTLAGSMVFGSAMVTMADADSEQTNAQGYKPGQVYRGDQNKFDAKGEALPGYHWDYKKLTDYVDGYYDTKQNPICAKTEHEHTAYTGTCYTKNTCDDTEHVHTESCYAYKNCDIKEHKHTWGACYTKVLGVWCKKEAHAFTGKRRMPGKIFDM